MPGTGSQALRETAHENGGLLEGGPWREQSFCQAVVPRVRSTLTERSRPESRSARAAGALLPSLGVPGSGAQGGRGEGTGGERRHRDRIKGAKARGPLGRLPARISPARSCAGRGPADVRGAGRGGRESGRVRVHVYLEAIKTLSLLSLPRHVLVRPTEARQRSRVERLRKARLTPRQLSRTHGLRKS